MRNFAKCMLCFLPILFFIGCHQFGTNSLQGTESPDPVKLSIDKVIPFETHPNQKDILAAFRFWVNKHTWLYEDFQYVDEQRAVEIYYKKIDENGFQGYLGYLYFPFQQKGKMYYEQFVFFFGEEGFDSEPSHQEDIKEIDDELIYLGKEIFYFSKEDVSKPEFPTSSLNKKHFIERARQKITELIQSFEEPGKGEYQAYIQDFTNQDTSTYVTITKGNNEIWTGEIAGYIQLDDGSISKDDVLYRGSFVKPWEWSDERLRGIVERKIQISICDFTVTVS